MRGFLNVSGRAPREVPKGVRTDQEKHEEKDLEKKASNVWPRRLSYSYYIARNTEDSNKYSDSLIN